MAYLLDGVKVIGVRDERQEFIDALLDAVGQHVDVGCRFAVGDHAERDQSVVGEDRYPRRVRGG